MWWFWWSSPKKFSFLTCNKNTFPVISAGDVSDNFWSDGVGPQSVSGAVTFVIAMWDGYLDSNDDSTRSLDASSFSFVVFNLSSYAEKCKFRNVWFWFFLNPGFSYPEWKYWLVCHSCIFKSNWGFFFTYDDKNEKNEIDQFRYRSVFKQILILVH